MRTRHGSPSTSSLLSSMSASNSTFCGMDAFEGLSSSSSSSFQYSLPIYKEEEIQDKDKVIRVSEAEFQSLNIRKQRLDDIFADGEEKVSREGYLWLNHE
jgi:hypothetical protein